MNVRVRDRLLAAAVMAAGIIELLLIPDTRGSLWLNFVFVAAAGALLAWRRRYALPAGAAGIAVVVAMNAELTRVQDIVWPLVVLLIYSYSFAAHLPARAARAGLALSLAAVVGVNLLQESAVAGDFIFPGTFATLSWAAGRVVRSRSELAAELHEAAVRAEEAREHDAAQAVADERRRIARELHDVVAHSMSVMVVQAGGARRILDRDPGRAEEAAAQIERTGREALSEMRRLLGVLRPGDDARAPQPGLNGLGELVERARGAGLAVELSVRGERPALPPGLELAAYRIVQEALTNAMKHAGSARTRVAISYDAELVDVLVENDPGLEPAPVDGQEPGHGLVGMRERVRLFGGELHTGARQGGGFTVHATLPLTQP